MQQVRTETPTPEEIDRALIEALKVFARRGRFLREQRERAARLETPAAPTSDTCAGEDGNRTSESPLD